MASSQTEFDLGVPNLSTAWRRNALAPESEPAQLRASVDTK
jgi:hypothetical protein